MSIARSRTYALVVFILTFALLLSDYMSRQVLSAVFPLLKAEWGLTDAQLGSLSGVVSLTVGLLAIPLALLADRWGRVKSLALMAALWSLATLGGALAHGYTGMLAARIMVGVGEAAYGSVGLAVVLAVMPARVPATLTGIFFAGGMFGSVIGTALGGAIAGRFGWRSSFEAMALFGLVLAALYLLLVREPKNAQPSERRPLLSELRKIVSGRSLFSAYFGSGLQLFIAGAAIAWLPSFLNRSYHLPTAKAAGLAAIFLLISAVGMMVCGALGDRLGRHAPERKVTLSIGLALGSAVLLSAAFSLGPSPAQLVLIAAGMFIVAGTIGPAGAMVANLAPPALHGTAFALLALANNILGLAAGPVVTGILADRFGLQTALQVVPLMSVIAALAFASGKRFYGRDVRELDAAAVVAS
jgi:MFS family permease